MISFDIPININISAETEEEAEQYITSYMSKLMATAALERAVNSWDFIEFVEGENEEDYSDESFGL